MVDARHGLPIAGFTTTADRHDTRFLPKLLDRASETFGWFKPKHVIGDKGYDSNTNYRNVIERGASPIIPMRKAKDQNRAAPRHLHV